MGGKLVVSLLLTLFVLSSLALAFESESQEFESEHLYVEDHFEENAFRQEHIDEDFLYEGSPEDFFEEEFFPISNLPSLCNYPQAGVWTIENNEVVVCNSVKLNVDSIIIKDNANVMFDSVTLPWQNSVVVMDSAEFGATNSQMVAVNLEVKGNSRAEVKGGEIHTVTLKETSGKPELNLDSVKLQNLKVKGNAKLSLAHSEIWTSDIENAANSLGLTSKNNKYTVFNIDDSKFGSVDSHNDFFKFFIFKPSNHITNIENMNDMEKTSIISYNGFEQKYEKANVNELNIIAKQGVTLKNSKAWTVTCQECPFVYGEDGHADYLMHSFSKGSLKVDGILSNGLPNTHFNGKPFFYDSTKMRTPNMILSGLQISENYFLMASKEADVKVKNVVLPNFLALHLDNLEDGALVQDSELWGLKIQGEAPRARHQVKDSHLTQVWVKGSETDFDGSKAGFLNITSTDNMRISGSFDVQKKEVNFVSNKVVLRTFPMITSSFGEILIKNQQGKVLKALQADSSGKTQYTHKFSQNEVLEASSNGKLIQFGVGSSTPINFS